MSDTEKELDELRQMADLDRREMENQYAQFAAQYDALKVGVKDPIVLVALERQQHRADSLLQELKRTRTEDKAKLLRLKRELMEMRANIATYTPRTDSIQALNANLMRERDEAVAKLAEAQRRIQELKSKQNILTQKVEEAAHLTATAVRIVPQKRSGKVSKRAHSTAKLVVLFNISRNSTTEKGVRKLYVRVTNEAGEVIGRQGEAKVGEENVAYSVPVEINFKGAEIPVHCVIDGLSDFPKGTYKAEVFSEDLCIGKGQLELNR